MGSLHKEFGLTEITHTAKYCIIFKKRNNTFHSSARKKTTISEKCIFLHMLKYQLKYMENTLYSNMFFSISCIQSDRGNNPRKKGRILSVGDNERVRSLHPHLPSQGGGGGGEVSAQTGIWASLKKRNRHNAQP